MAPTRRSTRAKSIDKVVAGPSPSTRATRARPATKTGSPAAKPRTKQPRKTTSKAQAIPEVEETEEEEEEEEQEKVQEKQKPKAKSTRRSVAKAQTVPRAEEEEEEEKEVISQEEIEEVVAAATRRSNRAASVASLQTPTKSKAARGRVAKKVAPARKIRGAVVEEEEVVPEVTHTKTSRGRKPHIETTNSPVTTSTEILDAVVVRSRSKRQDAKKLKNLIEEPVVAEGSADASATPSWAKKRGGKKAKIVEDEAADSNLDQRTGAEIELAKVDDVEDTSIKDTEPEPVVAKGRGRKKGMKAPQGEAVVEELKTTIEVVKSEPALKGRGSRKGKKAEAVPEEPEVIAEEIAVGVAEPEPVSKGKSNRGKKADAVPEATVIEDTTIEVTKPEPAPKGRGGKKGRKVDAVSKEPQVIVEVAQPEPVLKGRVGRRGGRVDPVTEEPEDIIEEAAIVADTEAPKGRSKRGKKVDAVPENPEVVIEDATIEAAEPEPAPKGRGSRRGNKIDAVLETAVDPEPVVAKGKGRGKGKKVVDEIEAVAEEPESVVEEPRPVPAKGTGRRKGNKVDAVVAEPEPVAEDTEPEPVVAKRKGGRRAAKAVEGTEAAVEALEITTEDSKTEVPEPEPLLPKGRGRNRGKQAVQVEITDTNVNQTAVDAGTEIEKADAVAEATSQEPQIVGDTQIVVTEELTVKSKVRRGKKVVSAKKGTRGGRKVMAELPDVEMSDTDVQTQKTEVDVEMEPIATTTTTTTSPNVKDSGVFLENEFMVGGPSVDKSEHITEGFNVTAVEESAVAAEAETEVVVLELNVVSEAEPILTVQSEVTVEVDTEVTAIQPVVVGPSTGQTRAITDETETEVGVSEPSNLLAKSPGSSRKKTPRGKETTQAIVPVEQDVEMGEPSVGGEKYGPSIELELALEKSSTDIEMPVSDGIEPKEAIRAPKPRKKAKRPSTAVKKERQAKFMAKKVRGSSSGGFEALDTSSDIFFDGIPSETIEKKEIKEAEGEEVMAGREFVEDEEGEPDLPQPFSSPVTKPTIILSPRRASPDPDLDPIKTPVPSSPIDHRMSHPLNSSPLRQNGPDPVVLASPRMVTTPSNSPSKKRSTPNTRTPINRLPGSGISFGRNLEDSRDVRSISTPARGRNSSVASSPIMMPPATPNVVAGDARSPTKQTPTKESEVVGDMLDRVDGPSMLIGITNINSSPVKNSTPIRTGSGIEKSSPVGRLNFGGSDISQSSPLVGRLQINDPSLLLSSPLAVPSKTFSPTKAQQNSPTRSSPLKHSPLGKPNYSLNFVVCHNLTLRYDSNGFHWVLWG